MVIGTLLLSIPDPACLVPELDTNTWHADSTSSTIMPASGDKTAWPELVGQDATAAQATLEKETSKSIFTVPMGNMVTMDYRPDRVRIFYDPATNKVTKAPKIG